MGNEINMVFFNGMHLLLAAVNLDLEEFRGFN